jgi:predicted aspartyl protease
MELQAFTRKYNSITAHIISECEISKPIGDSSQETMMTTFCALWDTGASCSSIAKEVAEKLGLTPVSRATVYHANGQSIVNLYDISMALPNKTLFKYITVAEGMYTGFDMLIGMDIITKGDFSISNFDGKTTFSFRIPSCKETDFVTESDETKENDNN